MNELSMLRKSTKSPGSTEFQLHRSQLQHADGYANRVIDFTEYKLLLLLKSARGTERRTILGEILEKYRRGEIAVGWEGGTRPIYIPVTFDTRF